MEALTIDLSRSRSEFSVAPVIWLPVGRELSSAHEDGPWIGWSCMASSSLLSWWVVEPWLVLCCVANAFCWSFLIVTAEQVSMSSSATGVDGTAPLKLESSSGVVTCLISPDKRGTILEHLIADGIGISSIGVAWSGARKATVRFTLDTLELRIWRWMGIVAGYLWNPESISPDTASFICQSPESGITMLQFLFSLNPIAWYSFGHVLV